MLLILHGQRYTPSASYIFLLQEETEVKPTRTLLPSSELLERERFLNLLLSLVALIWKVEQSPSSSVAMEIEGLLESLQRQDIYIKNPNKIWEYLLEFPDLIDVVPVAVDSAKQHFPDAQLVMDVYQDPEIDDCYLVIYVRFKQYDDSIVERLKKARAAFLDRLVGKRGWIQLTTDFREPE